MVKILLWYQKIKKQLKIHTKLLLSKRARNSEIVRLTHGETKFLSKEYDSPVSTIIYNNKVLITIWNQETPLAISIESKEISKSYKDNFEVMWKIAKK